jgi:DNA-3-methyladenine glycosylase
LTLEEVLRSGSLQAAPALLGRRLESSVDGVTTAVAIVEVEAYSGPDDPASHAFRGRTPRNAPMFGRPGGLYIYRSYGIHWCMNVVCGDEDDPQAVLLRGGRPLQGLEQMVRRRGRNDHVADGPGKLCQALGVTGDHDGSTIFDGPILIGDRVLDGTIETSRRIGITKAVEREWRFELKEY